MKSYADQCREIRANQAQKRKIRNQEVLLARARRDGRTKEALELMKKNDAAKAKQLRLEKERKRATKLGLIPPEVMNYKKLNTPKRFAVEQLVKHQNSH